MIRNPTAIRIKLILPIVKRVLFSMIIN
jgi:hypothetical protein